MRSRLIIIDTDWQTVAAVQDLLEVLLSGTQTGYVSSWKVAQSNLEGVTAITKDKIKLKRATGSWTSGSGGGTPNYAYGCSSDPAHGFTRGERNNTTQAVVGSGAFSELDSDILNESAGVVECTYIPEERPLLLPSEGLVLSLEEAPSASSTMRAIIKLLMIAG